jgi:hypothetical protein
MRACRSYERTRRRPWRLGAAIATRAGRVEGDVLGVAVWGSSSSFVFLLDEQRFYTGIIIHFPMIDQRSIEVLEILPRSFDLRTSTCFAQDDRYERMKNRSSF